MLDLVTLQLVGLPTVKAALTLSQLDAAVLAVDPAPTEAQKDSGNYRKARVSWKGLELTIETARGQYRRGVDKGGKPWKTLMKDHYGYIRGTESEADGDHIDIFLCEDDLESEIVFVVNQFVADKFDEHKVVLGVTSAARAEAVYRRNYDASWNGFDSQVAMTLPQFKQWLVDGDTGVAITPSKAASFNNDLPIYGHAASPSTGNGRR